MDDSVIFLWKLNVQEAPKSYIWKKMKTSPSNQAYVAACKADNQSSSIQSWEFVFPLHFIYWHRSLSDLSLSAGVVFCFRPEISRIPAGLFLCKAHKFGRGNLWQNCRKQQQHRQARPFVNQGKLQSFQQPVDIHIIFHHSCLKIIPTCLLRHVWPEVVMENHTHTPAVHGKSHIK